MGETFVNADISDEDYWKKRKEQQYILSPEHRLEISNKISETKGQLEKVERGEISFDNEVEKMAYIYRLERDCIHFGTNLIHSDDHKKDYRLVYGMVREIFPVKERLLHGSFDEVYPGYLEEIIQGIREVNTKEEAEEICKTTLSRFRHDFNNSLMEKEYLTTGRRRDYPHYSVEDSKKESVCSDALSFVGSRIVNKAFAPAAVDLPNSNLATLIH